MKLFSYLYDKTIFWSAHRYARHYLAVVAFAESSFFPIPPDIMLVSMGLAKPKKSWQYAFIATLFSVIGGIFGYYIGFFAIKLIEPYIIASSFADQYYNLQDWLKNASLWLVVLAGFTPFPYKIFTITAGALHIPIFVFIIGSLIGRGIRFFAVSGVLYYVGDSLEKNLRRYVDLLGYSLLLVLVLGYYFYSWK